MESRSVEDSSTLLEHEDAPYLRKYRSHSIVQVPSELDKHSAPVSFLLYKTTDFIYDLKNCPLKRRDNGFKCQLLDKWYAAKGKEVFNYDLNCIYKLLDGDYDFSLQLNIERGTLRRKPMRFQSIRQPFNHLRFNFTKLKHTEILYHLRCVDRPYTDDKLDVHALAINASPMEKGHSLVIPSLNKCFPQVLNSTGVRLALDLMLLVEDTNFHVLFNSLLAMASVNHMHLHALFWPYESAIVNRKCELFHENIYVLRRPNWFIQSLVFQIQNASQFDDFISNVTHCAEYLTKQNVAYNIFFTRALPIQLQSDDDNDDSSVNSVISDVKGDSRFVTAYIFPRQNHIGAKPPTNFNPAAAELAGFLTGYTYRFFESATEQSALRLIDEEAVISDFLFEILLDGLKRRYTAELSWDADDNEDVLLTKPYRTSQCFSDTGSFNNDLTVHSISELSVHEFESLSSHELDELSDAFHSVTSPLPISQSHLSARSLKSPKSRIAAPASLVDLFKERDDDGND